MDKVLAGFGKLGKAAFSSREYAALLGRRGYARLALHRLKKRGVIASVKRGWWAFSGAVPEAVACVVCAPCFLSFHSALHFHGLTTQIPRVVQVAVARNARGFEFAGNVVREYKIKKEGFNNFAARDGLLVATPEKAFADCLNVPRACTKTVLAEAAGGVDLGAVKKLVSVKGSLRLAKLLRELQNA